MRTNPLVTIIVALAAAIYAILDVMLGVNGPLAIAAKWTGIALVVLSFMRPKAGLVILSIICFYGDFYKKLAVVYGTVSLDTVIEVLAVNMAVVGAVIAGTLNQILISGRRPHRAVVTVGLLSFIIAASLMIGSAPLSSRAQMAVNGGLYFALAAVMGWQYQVAGQSLRLSRLHYMLGIPWVLMATYQYFYGFSDMDYIYARTFLSPVFSSQFYMENPRVFGLAGSASAYGGISLLFTYGLWRLFQPQARKGWLLLGSLIYFIGLLVSTQRTSLIQPFIVLVVWRLFSNRTSTRLFYSVIVSVALFLVSFSGIILNNLESIDNTLRGITGDHGWAAQVIRVGTFADRLKGWTRFTKWESYTLIGKSRAAENGPIDFGDDDFSHDMMNEVLRKYGIIGLLACLGIVIFTVRKAHAWVFEVKDPLQRSTVAFVLATLAVNLLLTLFGGSNVHTVPINLLLATLAGHAVAIFASPRIGSVQPASSQPSPFPQLPSKPVFPLRSARRMGSTGGYAPGPWPPRSP